MLILSILGLSEVETVLIRKCLQSLETIEVIAFAGTVEGKEFVENELDGISYGLIN